MKTPDLKPCPFCGYENPKMTEKRSGNNERTGDMFQILCGRCRARGPIFTARYSRTGDFGRHHYKADAFATAEAQQKAIEAWNRRVTDEQRPR